MLNLSVILENLLLEEKVDSKKVDDAINEKYRVIINYDSHGEKIAMGWRIIEVFAYGLTKAGNPVIRAYQPEGDTASNVPSWKFFRLDRILNWKPTGQYFTQPRPKFNPNGDETMSIVYNIAKFNDDEPDTKAPNITSPKRKEDDTLFKTPGEEQEKQKLNKLQQQVDKPVYKDDFMNKIKTKDGFKNSDIKNNENPISSTGPKRKEDDTLFKAPGEEQEKQKLNKLQQQVDSPIYKNDFKKEEQPLINKPEQTIFKTDTEKQIDKMRDQINNPRFVDPSIMRDYEMNKNKRNNKNI